MSRVPPFPLAKSKQRSAARQLRQDLAKDRNSTSSQHNFVKWQWKGPELDPVLCMP
ncbi:MAG: hypothetical protein ACRECP_03095 [Methylocella sp.]